MRDATLGQASLILDVLRDSGITKHRLDILLKHGVFHDILQVEELPKRNFFRRLLGLPPVDLIFTIHVNFDEPVKVKLSGLDSLAEAFPAQLKGHRELEAYVKFPEKATHAGFLDHYLTAHGKKYQLGGLHELVALQEQHDEALLPEPSLYAPIISGESGLGGKGYPCLRNHRFLLEDQLIEPGKDCVLYVADKGPVF